jgi:hypothetical protein
MSEKLNILLKEKELILIELQKEVQLIRYQIENNKGRKALEEFLEISKKRKAS